MRDVRERIESGRNWFQNLASQIPGLSGYLERETRRDADKMVRDHIVGLLTPLAGKLNQAKVELTNRLQLEQLDEVERVSKRLETLTDRIRYADRGYGGFFDAVKINEAELDRVYQSDVALVEGVAALSQALDGVTAASRSGGDIVAALAAVSAQLDAWDEGLRRRESILSGIA